jgi:hypothetical protein
MKENTRNGSNVAPNSRDDSISSGTSSHRKKARRTEEPAERGAIARHDMLPRYSQPPIDKDRSDFKRI